MRVFLADTVASTESGVEQDYGGGGGRNWMLLICRQVIFCSYYNKIAYLQCPPPIFLHLFNIVIKWQICSCTPLNNLRFLKEHQFFVFRHVLYCIYPPYLFLKCFRTRRDIRISNVVSFGACYPTGSDSERYRTAPGRSIRSRISTQIRIPIQPTLGYLSGSILG